MDRFRNKKSEQNTEDIKAPLVENFTEFGPLEKSKHYEKSSGKLKRSSSSSCKYTPEIPTLSRELTFFYPNSWDVKTENDSTYKADDRDNIKQKETDKPSDTTVQNYTEETTTLNLHFDGSKPYYSTIAEKHTSTRI